MTNSNFEELQHMAKAYGLKFSDKGNGHIQLSNHGFMVNYWPESKKRTVNAAGQSHKHCSNYDAIRICLDGASIGAKPDRKRMTKNVANVDFKPQTMNKPKPKHLYSGEKPPWEYPTMIRCWPDILRAEAHELQLQAAAMENPESYQE